MKTVVNRIKQVAHTNFSVIIQGETGTGKSVVAGAIQNLSARSERPFVSVDIGLIPDLLVESELFGYKKGAFTGAERDKAGYFETAHSGTIFLDELENMSPHVQAKLLSVIEKKRIYPLGGTSPVDVDIRIIAATNKDIKESVDKKEFREDLFYRLGEFFITLPPLRDRVDDIPFFARKFAFDAGTELNKQIREIEGDTLSLLVKYSWPGNLRELKNVMRRATLLAEGDVIDRKCVEALICQQGRERNACPVMPLKEAVRDLERRIIIQALVSTEGNKTKAAELLDLSYATLFAKIKDYGIK
jgi:transcriptional regulator with PAS, ATPase and Fis domain